MNKKPSFFLLAVLFSFFIMSAVLSPSLSFAKPVTLNKIKIFDDDSPASASGTVSLDPFDTIESAPQPAKAKTCFAQPGQKGKLFIIAVNGSGSTGEFSDAVKKNLDEQLTGIETPEVFPLSDFNDNAKKTGEAIQTQINAILAKDPDAKILVAAHSFGAISAFNYKVSTQAVSYKLYDPPYNALGTGTMTGVLGGWLFNTPREIRNARNNGIDKHIEGNWTNGYGSPFSKEQKEKHVSFRANNAVLNGVSDWVKKNCQ